MNIKRILTILTVCAACSTLGASTVDYTLLVLQPATVDVTQGQSFSATVNLFEVYVQDPFNPLPPDSVAGFQFDLMYPSFLSVEQRCRGTDCSWPTARSSLMTPALRVASLESATCSRAALPRFR